MPVSQEGLSQFLVDVFINNPGGDGEWRSFHQEEGLPQGCPFSPVIATLVLHLIIYKIDKLLRTRAISRKQYKILLDKGRITNLMAYMDDINAVVPHQDAMIYCNTFKN